MATTITMPQLGETVTEGTVAQWLKKIGDTVEKYEAFVEVSTDKVNAEVPSPVTGVIKEMLVKEGETVPTGAPIAVIDEVGAATGSNAAGTEPTQQVADAASAQAAKPAAGNGTPTNGHARSENVIPSSYGAPGGLASDADADAALRKASPAVRKLAREHHIDIRSVAGSGANGRVTADDVLTASRMGPAAAVGQAIGVGTNFGATGAPAAMPPGRSYTPPSAPAGSATSTYGEPIPGTVIPLNNARRIIAERMVESKHNAPHAWSMVEVDVTGVWKWRAREKDRFERETGYKLTLLPFFIRAVIESISAFPLMNAKFTAEGLYVNKDVNIGIAIGLPTNLVVPVIKNADKLSIKGLAIAAGELIDKARKNKLGVDDLAGGTFTVNNNGANGSYASAPIINAGQAGIVTMETVVKKPVVLNDDSIAIRHMMNSCLSLDHRVVDGYVASGFLADLKKRLERMDATGAL
ncbi:MAG TPA: dihydrolipoamide acetyltransferase family protein [Candidatus Baltobacteraceae bacterium]|jgi:2-oxoisovalerate dehydrogenase E2 component (dihydrolipoyl transacylase)|nr:dihydrolipoamide acetyltransferase family protein [Candidatus Baltobacteraceae bacterium]